jgi:hypothetical protein
VRCWQFIITPTLPCYRYSTALELDNTLPELEVDTTESNDEDVETAFKRIPQEEDESISQEEDEYDYASGETR